MLRSLVGSEMCIRDSSLKSQLELALNENKILKSKNDCNDVLKKNEILSSKLDIVLQEKDAISNERDSLKSQLELAIKENEILKNQNDCENVLKKNESLTLKLDFVLKENNSLKNKIELISKELEVCLNKNKSLKNNLDTHVCHVSSINKFVACSTSSSSINNDICMLKKSVDCLGFTLSQCVMNHTVGIHVSKETSFKYTCTQITAYTCFPRSYS